MSKDQDGSLIEPPRPARQRPAQYLDARPPWWRTALLAAIAVCAVEAATFVTLSQVQDSARGRQTNRIVKTLALEEQQINSVTGPKATARSAAETAHLIACLENRIDVDTGHAKLMGGCP